MYPTCRIQVADGAGSAGSDGRIDIARAVRPPRALALATEVCLLLESLGHAAAVFDGGGTLLRATSQFRSTTDTHEVYGQVLASARALATAPGYPRAGFAGRTLVAPDEDCAELVIASVLYRLRRLSFRDDGGRPAGATPAGLRVVVLRVTAAGDARAEHLRDRFGLTRREAEVALLLSEGLSTPAVARQLAVSVHTARHHGERVFRKLGVRSRLAVVRQLGLLHGPRQEPGAD